MRNYLRCQSFCVIVNIYLYKNLGEELQASSIILYKYKYILVKNFGRRTLREVNHSVWLTSRRVPRPKFFRKQNNKNFKNVPSPGVFLFCFFFLLSISSSVLSTELYDIHCIDSIHSKQLCVVLHFKVLCRAVVSLQFCFETNMDNCVIGLWQVSSAQDLRKQESLREFYRGHFCLCNPCGRVVFINKFVGRHENFFYCKYTLERKTRCNE